jgi:hypothetical protein
VRLPLAFAQKLFAETRNGDTVVVANAKASSASLTYPAVLAPVNEKGKQSTQMQPSLAGYSWNDDAAPDGPVSVLVSMADKHVFVLRNGVNIAEGPLEVADGFALHGSVLMVIGNEKDNTPSLIDPSQTSWQWSAYPILGVNADSLPMLQMELQDRPLRVDDAFAKRIHAILTPGTTILLTDLPAQRDDAKPQPMEPVLQSED